MAYLTKAQAEYRAERLAHHIRKYDVKVVVDLRPGAGGNHWGVDTHIGAMAHHIVSKRSQGLTPFYKLVRNGRSDVPGPLCNVYGGFDRVARIVTMGLANHSGKGGPWVISGRRIPQDNGRYYFLGTEFEGGLDPDDWDADFRRFMGAVNAGKLDYIRELRGSSLEIRDTALCEHSDWARPKGRKVDRLGYNQAKGVAEMQAARRIIRPTPKPKPIPPAPKPVGPFDWITTMFKDQNDFQRFLDRRLDEANRRDRAVQNAQLNNAWLRDAGAISENTLETLSKVLEAHAENLLGAITALEDNGENFDMDKYLAGTQKAVREALAESVRVTGELRPVPVDEEQPPLPAEPTT